ncbi:FkbM family methyltransferase [Horticoccus luteus]|uniref:FkbM family methyltransferase n=1 Tax=Horticoccus luteus TaxID=2862869 RepID=A0A8F9XMP6_9BACT|nr:FkbM family methyltransferase [Horticoccus luteus]QYM80486.1 FkbM family methyltransferase [Horticoccus luteus]
MISAHALAKKVRHFQGLRNLEALWRWLRPVYQWLLDPLGRGVQITLGGRAVRFPAALLSHYPDWSGYERESFEALAGWLDSQPGRLTLLDIGCSFGVVTSFAVQICPRVEVIAFDSDLTSLRALDAVVPSGALDRVKRVHGLLGATHASGSNLEAAIATTLRQLPAIPPKVAINHSQYVCFGEAGARTVPQHQLDALLAGVAFPGPVLLKCDVEGAELLVLNGAAELLRRIRPALLLSVHPPALPRFGPTPEDVAAFLTQHHYRWNVLARDHEEHWWCEPISS